MRHPFEALSAEYSTLLATVIIQRHAEAANAARRLADSAHLPRYRDVGAELGVPAALLAALDERESGADPLRALGQGDRWDRVSTHVPRGFGPFANWSDAAIFYARRERLDIASAPWAMPYCCFKAEGWNGFGPRDHGVHTGYLWAGTNHYTRGKYVADGQWNPGFVDPQLGVVPIMLTLGALMPELVVPGVPPAVPPAFAPPVPLPAPDGAGSARWVQVALNKLGENPPLREDGSYGRFTRAAVRRFQNAHGLQVDGWAGHEQTIPAIAAELSQRGLAA